MHDHLPFNEKTKADFQKKYTNDCIHCHKIISDLIFWHMQLNVKKKLVFLIGEFNQFYDG